MSYDPVIIINYAALDEKRRELEEHSWGTVPASKQSRQLSYQTLLEAVKRQPVYVPSGHPRRTFGVVLIHPELTMRNQDVRDLLDLLSIPYTLWHW